MDQELHDLIEEEIEHQNNVNQLMPFNENEDEIQDNSLPHFEDE